MAFQELRLYSPAGAEPLLFQWPLVIIGRGKDKIDGAQEIVETIKLVREDFPDSIQAINNIVKVYDPNSYESMKNLCDKYNKLIDTILKLEKGTSISSRNNIASRTQLKHIICQVYNTAVTEPEKLNTYEPFSPEVYGETSFDLICQIIDNLHIGEEDLFVDLGSGVGQVVLQMAALTSCRQCYGIEKAEVPSLYAKSMDVQFKKWMKWFGKRYQPYELTKADFLSEEEKSKITQANIIFVNNFAFGPTVDHKLKELFQDLKDGARVVSSKSFCGLNFRITDRNLGDIGTIMHVKELSPINGSVSWTNNPVTYFLHVIDRTKLERYFASMKNGRGDENCAARRSMQGKKTVDSSSNDSNSNLLINNKEENVVGPTTRKAWSDWCSSTVGGKSSKENSEDETNVATNSKNQKPNKAKPKGKKKVYRKKKNKNEKIKKKPKVEEEDEEDEEDISINLPPPPIQTTARGGGANNCRKAKGRIKKTKKIPNILGLDLLHTQTLLSTSPQGKKLPAAPGCIDQKLTLIGNLGRNGVIKHEELSIATRDTPYALQKLLDLYREQFLDEIEKMKSDDYKKELENHIKFEKEKNEALTLRKNQLNNEIDNIVSESTILLRAKFTELEIPGEGADVLLNEARRIVMEHKEIQGEMSKLSNEVNDLEKRKEELVEERKLEWKEMCRKNGFIGRKSKITEVEEQECFKQYLLQEITGTINHRNLLEFIREKECAQSEDEIQQLETSRQIKKPKINSSPKIASANPPAILSNNNKKEKNLTRQKSQDNWPDIPMIEQIQENNPDLLAKSILAIGRQFEEKAGKAATTSTNTKKSPEYTNVENRRNYNTNSVSLSKVQQNAHVHPLLSPTSSFIADKAGLNKSNNPAPRISFYEEGLNNIITNALNEDNFSNTNQPSQQKQNSSFPVVAPNKSMHMPSNHQYQQQQQQHYHQNQLPVVAKGNLQDHHRKPNTSMEVVQNNPSANYSNHMNNMNPLNTPAKVALRKHLNNNEQQQIPHHHQHNQHQPHFHQRMEIGRQPQASSPTKPVKTMHDLISVEIENSLGIKGASGGQQNFSSISRPNSIENIHEVSLKNNYMRQNSNLISPKGVGNKPSQQLPSRASVLVNTVHHTLQNQIDKNQNGSNSHHHNSHQNYEGLAAGIKLLSKSPGANDNIGSSKNKEKEKEDLSSSLFKNAKVVETNGKLTEVVLGSKEHHNNKDIKENGDSVLCVSKKRVSDSMDSPTQIKKFKNESSFNSNDCDIRVVQPPKTPTPKLSFGENNSNSPGRCDSPDVLWKKGVTSEFDKLFSFAEKDKEKRRRSTEAAAALSSSNAGNSPQVVSTTTSERPSKSSFSSPSPDGDSGIGKDTCDYFEKINENRHPYRRNSRPSLLPSKYNNNNMNNDDDMDMEIPRTPSPSHVDDYDDIEIPPKTPYIRDEPRSISSKIDEQDLLPPTPRVLAPDEYDLDDTPPMLQKIERHERHERHEPVQQSTTNESLKETSPNKACENQSSNSNITPTTSSSTTTTTPHFKKRYLMGNGEPRDPSPVKTPSLTNQSDLQQQQRPLRPDSACSTSSTSSYKLKSRFMNKMEENSEREIKSSKEPLPQPINQAQQQSTSINNTNNNVHHMKVDHKPLPPAGNYFPNGGNLIRENVNPQAVLLNKQQQQQQVIQQHQQKLSAPAQQSTYQQLQQQHAKLQNNQHYQIQQNQYQQKQNMVAAANIASANHYQSTNQLTVHQQNNGSGYNNNNIQNPKMGMSYQYGAHNNQPVIEREKQYNPNVNVNNYQNQMSTSNFVAFQTSSPSVQQTPQQNRMHNGGIHPQGQQQRTFQAGTNSYSQQQQQHQQKYAQHQQNYNYQRAPSYPHQQVMPQSQQHNTVVQQYSGQQR